MSLAAIITIPARFQTNTVADRVLRVNGEGDSSRPIPIEDSSPLLWELFGQSVFDHLLGQFRRGGVEHISVLREERSSNNRAYSQFWSEWERVASTYLSNGIDALLLISMRSYTELDICELLKFRQHTGSPLTQVHRAQTPLDIVLVDGQAFRSCSGSFRSRLNSVFPRQRGFRFMGYFNPMETPRDFRILAQDSLLGRTQIRPCGNEVQPGIWYGDGARVAASAQIDAPAYIGGRTRVSDSCTVTGASVIEGDCEVDCGTSIDRCCVFPATYIGIGLRVSDALVAPSGLFHLQRNLTVNIRDLRLLGDVRRRHRLQPKNLARKARSLLSGSDRPPVRLSTNSSQTASLQPARWFGRSG